jgi:hypothetical protein
MGRTKQAASWPAGNPAFIKVGEFGRNSRRRRRSKKVPPRSPHPRQRGAQAARSPAQPARTCRQGSPPPGRCYRGVSTAPGAVPENALARMLELLAIFPRLWRRRFLGLSSTGYREVVEILNRGHDPGLRWLFSCGLLPRYRLNQSAAKRAASCSVPGSSNKWVAPGTISSCFSALSFS